ncbi:hypothetical protein niasHT_002833 [Heterodera trifolii]|uniref:Nucleolar protein 10 n=1 Tax=Heterodera trifolii TaxID=157864 RepID=A0ABD2LQJ9_9BILA
MQLSISNNVKIYNLSSGKSLPDWITAKKRRKLEKQDEDIRKRIQLVQDLEMPSVSHTVNFSPDGHYFFATGSYKPMVKCYDLDELTLKFERGLDADVVKFLLLSDDYSKFILLEEERHVEFHTNYGRYFRLRIPDFGRDMAFCHENSEVNIVGCHSDIFRLNLELGRFHEPLRSEADSLTCCAFNESHQLKSCSKLTKFVCFFAFQLFVCGTGDARVEAWDQRCRRRVAMLDCVLNKAIELELDLDSGGGSQIEVSSICFKDALHLAVGLSNGYVLLYDVRSSKPYLSKNHNFGLPITRLQFAREQELVLSMDGRALKVWNEHNGQPFTSIEPGMDLRDFARYPNSGIIMFANDEPKIQQFFVPSLGPAPRWCSHLESITEELEAEKPSVYDDFKFVTKSQLEELGLSKLIGTNALRAYMHGFFVDMGTYKKARSQCQLSAFEAYREKKLQHQLEQERSVQFVKRNDVGGAAGQRSRKLPKVNRELAARLQAELSINEAATKTPDTTDIDGKTGANKEDGTFAAVGERGGDGDEAASASSKSLAAAEQPSLAAPTTATKDAVSADHGTAIAAAAAVTKPKKHALLRNIMVDKRFESLFMDPDMQIDEDSDQYKHLEPMMKKMEAKRQRTTTTTMDRRGKHRNRADK